VTALLLMMMVAYQPGTVAGAGAQLQPPPKTPQLARPDKFEIELFSNFKSLGRLKAFQLTLWPGKQGFRRGLYVTSGPAGDDRSDRIVRVDRRGRPSVVGSGFVSNETLVFARGRYGNGLLVTEPLRNRIVRLLPNGKRKRFAVVGTAPFGPAGLFYDTKDRLLVTDFSGATVRRVSSNGNSKPFARVPVPPPQNDFVAGPKGGFGGGFGGGGFGGGGGGRSFVVGVFSSGPAARAQGPLYEISADGVVTDTIQTGLDSVELIHRSPGGKYGQGIFVPTVGAGQNADGGLFLLGRDKKLTPFLTGIDAVSVAFDTHRVLGGGMFVADINDELGAGKIWRIRPKP
jgi:hypothetical protein